MINRIRLAIKILLGYDIIIYKKNTKEVVAMVSEKEVILEKGLDIALEQYVTENNGVIRYLR